MKNFVDVLDKYRGDTPWWKIDPRKKPTAKSEQLKEDFDQTFESRDGRHHHMRLKSHRTDAGRRAAEDAIDEVHSRKKRGANDERGKMKHPTSEERNVETLIVVDKLLVGFHGRQQVETYILTIMNIVRTLFVPIIFFFNFQSICSS